MLCAMFSSDVGMLRVLAEHKADVNMQLKGLGGLAMLLLCFFGVVMSCFLFFLFWILFSLNSTLILLIISMSHAASKVHSATMTVKRSSWQQQSRARTLSHGSEFTVLMLSVSFN